MIRTAAQNLLIPLALAFALVSTSTAAMASADDDASNKAMQAASTVVIGSEIGLANADSDRRAMAKSPQFAALAADGVSYGEAVTYYKSRLTDKNSGVYRADAIGLAFQWVYGRTSTAIEQASWDGQLRAGSAWYATMVDSLGAQLAKSPGERNKMIIAAYYHAFGRGVTGAELTYWMPRAEVFGQMNESNRAWLYSPSGAEELVATVTRRRLSASLPPTANIKQILAKLSAKRLLYSEMIASDLY